MAASFEIILNHGMGQFSIKAPNSFSNLLEVVLQKFDLTIVNHLTYYKDSKEIIISNDNDYFNLWEYVFQNEMTEIELYVKSDESAKAKRKLSKNLRKVSNTIKPKPTTKVASSDDNCVNGKIFFIF